jgi:transcription termination factor Rho
MLDQLIKEIKSKVEKKIYSPMKKQLIKKAKCLVKQTRDMVILVDSITCLALAYSTIILSFGKALMGGECYIYVMFAKSQVILWCNS